MRFRVPLYVQYPSCNERRTGFSGSFAIQDDLLTEDQTADYVIHEKDKGLNGCRKEIHEEAQIPCDSDSLSLNIVTSDQTHRKLRPRHIQLIGIGGTIGTALYVQIGKGLLNGGPASLFLAFTIWCTFILAVTNVSPSLQPQHHST